MQLVMYVGNDFIASVPVNAQKITLPGYVGKLKRGLMNENSEALIYASLRPEFLVVNYSNTFAK